MPYKPKGGYKRSAKRRYRKTRKSSQWTNRPANPRYGLVRNMPGVSNSCYAVHSYVQNYPYTAGASGVYGTSQVWNLNDMFDPDKTGVGHQPYLHDTYSALYYRYKVIWVKVHQYITDPTADGIIVANYLRTPSNTSTIAGASPQVVNERPGCSTKIINNTGRQVVTYSRRIDIAKACGLSRAQFNADFTILSTTSGASPTLIPTLVTAIAALDATSTPTVNVVTHLTYGVQWYDRKTQSQS